MSDRTFVIHDGVPELVAMYWSNSPAIESRFPRRVDFYSEDSLYCHIRLRNLFITGDGTQRVHEGAKIAIDLYPLTYDEFRGLGDDFNSINGDAIRPPVGQIGNFRFYTNGEDEISQFFSLELALNPISECSISPDESGSTSAELTIENGLSIIDGANRSTTNSTITVHLNRVGQTTLNQVYDLCFELNIPEAYTERLDELALHNYYLLGWCWVITSSDDERYSTTHQYNDIFKVDITSSEDRNSSLTNPTADPAFRRMANLNWEYVQNIRNGFDVLGLLNYETYDNRYTYTRDHPSGVDGVDPFPFDEPSLNVISISSSLPFTELILGKQLGDVGLIQMSEDYFKETVRRGVTTRQATDFYTQEFVNGWIETDNEFYHGIDTSEYSTAGEEGFFFKEGSAAHWVNSIETTFCERSEINGLVNDITVKPFGQTRSAIELQTFDLLTNISSHNHRLIADLSEFHTIDIPNEPLLTAHGNSLTREGFTECKIALGKGFPANDEEIRFSNTMHNKVFLEGSRDLWQVHKICHRPIFLMYELERDLTEDEIRRLNNEPIKVIFQLEYDIRLNLETKRYSYELLFIDNLEKTKAGKHLVLLYPVFFNQDIEPSRVLVTLSTLNSNINISNTFERDSNENSYFCQGLKFQNVTSNKLFFTYEPERNGFFNDNPFILVDDIQGSEVRRQAIQNAQNEFANTATTEVGKFLTSFIPVVGGVVSSNVEMVVNAINGTAPSSLDQIELGYSIIDTFVSETIDKEPISNPVQSRRNRITRDYVDAAGNALEFTGMIDTLIDAKEELDRTIILEQHPFLRGNQFGTSRNEYDSLYLLAVKEIKRELILDPTQQLAVGYSVQGGKAAFVMNRHIDHRATQGITDFHYQFGNTAGLITRTNYNDKDSVSHLRTGYQRRIGVFKHRIESITNNTAGDMINRLAADQNLMNIVNDDDDDDLALNASFIDWISNRGIRELLIKKINNPNGFTMQEAIDVTIFVRLIQYVDASFVICPACNAPVSLSYGWCPYHATEASLDLEDQDGSGSLKEEFVAFLRENGKTSLLDILEEEFWINGEQNRERLLVHWTEFEIVR